MTKAETATDPYAVPDFLADRIDALDLWPQVKQMVDDGYCVINDETSQALAPKIRETILSLAQDTEGPGKGYSASLLLGRDPVFEEAILHQRLLTMAEYVTGKGTQISQVIGSVREKGHYDIPVHADNSWFPAPFPPWEFLLTACWALDDFTGEAGATVVVPGSHKERSHPPADLVASRNGMTPIEAPAGSIVLWNGSVWHSNGQRQIDGQRVVLHVTYSRIGFTPVENYSHLTDDWLQDKPETLATLLGRQVFFGTTTTTSKTVLITGGSRGIGEMLAEGFVTNGAKVYIVARKFEACQATAERLSEFGDCTALPGDLSTRDGVAALAKEIAGREDKLDVLINNAGATWGAPMEDFPEDGFDKVMDLNVKNLFYLTTDLLPQLRAATGDGEADTARVINVGSVDGIKAPLVSQNYPYSAAKAAVHQLTKHMAAHLVGEKILVNAIAPGPFPSKMTQFMIDAAPDAFEGSTPMNRAGRPEDIAGTAMFLASRASGFLTGHVLPCDGGYSTIT
ncbi:rhlG [Symbiodinium microadriaticum]|nr:rhlG [Symbiodinium microadriaticum]